MNKLIITIVILSSSLFSADINLKIQNLKSIRGKIFIGLYNKSDNFLNISKVYRDKNIKIRSSIPSYKFKKIPYGIYAVAIFHDENSNNKLDRNFFGIPKEGYGVSNNKKAFFSPPLFKDAKFRVSQKTINLKIKMRY